MQKAESDFPTSTASTVSVDRLRIVKEMLKAQCKKLKAIFPCPGHYTVSVDRLPIMKETLKAQGKKLKAVSDAHGIIQYQLTVYGS